MNKKRNALILTAALTAILTAGPASFGQTDGSGSDDDFRPPKLWERAEITLLGGLGIPFHSLQTLHSAEAGSSSDLLIKAKNTIRTSSAASTLAGASAAFFLSGRGAVQIGFGYAKAGLSCDGTAQFAVSGSTTAEFTGTAAGEGELTTVPVYLCFYNRLEFRVGEKTLQLNLSLGPTLAFNSVLASSRAGAVAVRDGEADGFLVPVQVEDTTWVSIGATAGLGLDVPLTKKLALTVQARYFYAERKSFSWKWTPGVYDGLRGRLADCAFDERDARLAAGDTTLFSVNPSLLQIAAGIKLIF